MIFGKTLVVTGVSSGIGARTAELAVSLGADVIGIDMKEPAIASSNFIKGDLSNPAGIEAVVRQLPKRFDALLNIAGISGKVGTEATLAINFYGLRAFTEAVAPRIREGGAVVNVASIAGYGWRANLERAKAMVAEKGFPDIKAVMAKNGVSNEEGYPLSKELLLLWTQKAAHEPLFKEHGVRVNAVSPGPVETQILKEFRSVLGDEKVDSDISRVGRAATASDIAPVILFLASDGARWINGANIANDGGLEASINADVLGF
ncbi:coniferyl-alcohol dehydrogenase [Rhizobium sp. KVB221]|uniref:Coniferyl-alcohol dehydrogenase n=1 Tax=Rhizobium setariae TaxID=2801340 RepID=A0A936YJS0_9HYPH|nr:coniferyl-alcohol dehydrogenase [Rhizobium setariae]MBL0371639.1 coniferyl-alcohol dehydrogenase [Rhizobium setariae]